MDNQQYIDSFKEGIGGGQLVMIAIDYIQQGNFEWMNQPLFYGLLTLTIPFIFRMIEAYWKYHIDVKRKEKGVEKKNENNN